jgi:hypothetical protein
MTTAANSLKLSHACAIDEARALVQRCAEPRSAGDLIKVAIFRASQRLNMPVSRVKDIWYGDARRIDAEEMDRLRQAAKKAELAQAVAAIELLKDKFSALPSVACDDAIKGLYALLDSHGEAFGN